MEEEIDLRPYIEILIRSWYWILLAGLIAGGTAYLVNKLTPDTYEAEAAVATIRERTNVSFNTSIRTQEEDLGGQDTDSRLNGLVALVTSSDVATQVLAEVGNELDEDSQTVPALLKMVEASNIGDLIIIKAEYTDPQLTSRIADVWVQVYENHVNTIYVSGPSSDQSVLTSQVATAESDYEAAKADTEIFIADNRITFLQNEIAAQSDLLTSYQAARNKIQSNPVDFQVNARQAVLSNFYSDLSSIEVWLADAQSLRQQVSAGKGSTSAQISNALALISLRGRISGGSSQSVLFQFDLENETLEPVTLADIDTVIEALETRKTSTLAQIEAFSLSFASVEPEELVIDNEHFISQRIVELNDDILALQAELSSQTAEQRELNQVQNLAWETYQTLTRKQKEVEIALASTGTEVRIASRSTVPDEPTNQSGLVSAILAAIVGGMIAIGAILIFYWWTDKADSAK